MPFLYIIFSALLIRQKCHKTGRRSPSPTSCDLTLETGAYSRVCKQTGPVSRAFSPPSADGSAIESESLLSRLPAFSRTAKIPDRRIFRIPFAAEKERPRLRAPGTGVRKGSVFRVRSARSRGCSRENGLRMVLGTFCHQTVPIYLFRKRKQEAQHSVITEQHSCITDQHKWHVF